jgi:hypothetical protein
MILAAVYLRPATGPCSIRGCNPAKPWRTLDFGPQSGSTTPPDWLILDLLGATYPMANDQWRIEQRQPDEFSTASFMNSTAGQINLNTRTYPRTPFFKAPDRTRPLKGVFANLPEIDAEALASSLANYQQGRSILRLRWGISQCRIDRRFGQRFVGEGIHPAKYGGRLTTKSNTFGIWGVAQVVKKIPRNVKYESFESGDLVQAEKRFYALVERYVWPGRDGIPGNAHTSGNGKWDRLAEQSTAIPASGSVPDTLSQLPGSPAALQVRSTPESRHQWIVC